MVKVTYYLDVTSSWCYWAEPAWAELKQRFKGCVEFDWKISALPKEAFPTSANQAAWFYRRSGTLMRSPFMLNSDWHEPATLPCIAPNCVALAAKTMGITDDRVRLALAHAALREGKKVGHWDVAVEAAAPAAGLDAARLLSKAKAPEISAQIETTTAEFYALQVTQRPTFLIENSIGDRSVFSGIARAEPLTVAIEALLADEAAYVSWKAHFGEPPPA
ncbi:MAG: DsbA family protein [Limisphaerales bacterium]